MREKPALALGWAGLAIACTWSYWSPVASLVGRWWNEPDYIYGFLVPVFSGVLLWIRRDMAREVRFEGTWWGLLVLGACAGLRWASAYYYFKLLDSFSLLFCLAGLVLLLGGWKALRWSWPAIAFLFFMIPLPAVVAGMLSHPLQRIATIASTYTLQTLGVAAIARGNVILLAAKREPLNVAEACSGLRMMMLFVTVCVAAAFLMKRGWFEKVIVVLSAAPIAVLSNVARVSITCLLYKIVDARWADAFFHDLAGWFMMPFAIVVLWGEMAVLSRLFPENLPSRPVALDIVGVKPQKPSRRKAGSSPLRGDR